jgi:ergothioneine biosynthesis protein EgtB
MSGLSVTRVAAGRGRLQQRFLSAWSRSDEIFGLIKDRALLAQPIVWRHPFIFYVGHLPAFTWNQICGSILKWTSFNPYFDHLFCRGIDPDVDTGECHWHPDEPERWPDLSEVLRYRDRVRETVLESVDALPRIHTDDVMARGGRVFEMVLEHEYMHQETLLYMMQELPLGAKNRPTRGLRYSFGAAAANLPVEIPPGVARLGAAFDQIRFGWDNELPAALADVPGFRIDSMPVTNEAFYDFVRSGAYNQVRYWRPEDWQWKARVRSEHPNCWFKAGEDWFYKAMFDVFPLVQVSSWPVYVTLAEARAYANWRGMRLPTESEFHRAAFSRPNESAVPNPWGEALPAAVYGNFDFTNWSPVPVGSRPAGQSGWGVAELVGNGWEWTDTSFAGFPGFTPYMKGYPDYSKDFFDGKHFVLKGGSWATASELLRPSFRNWYQAHYPHVFAKFRCVSEQS